MEKRLYMWINNEIEGYLSLSQAIIVIELIFNQIQVETGDITETIVASKGWFNRFKHRYYLYYIQITGKEQVEI